MVTVPTLGFLDGEPVRTLTASKRNTIWAWLKKYHQDSAESYQYL